MGRYPGARGRSSVRSVLALLAAVGMLGGSAYRPVAGLTLQARAGVLGGTPPGNMPRGQWPSRCRCTRGPCPIAGRCRGALLQRSLCPLPQGRHRQLPDPSQLECRQDLVRHAHGRRRLQQHGQRWPQLRKLSVRPFSDALLPEQSQPAADRGYRLSRYVRDGGSVAGGDVTGRHRWTPCLALRVLPFASTIEPVVTRLHLVVNNARFLLLHWISVRYLASSVLALAARQLPADWAARYGYRPLLLERTQCERTSAA